MSFAWLKKFMPRGIYGRAALILILPVVTLQLVVSVVFIQRHFEGVTRQLTQGVANEINLIHRFEPAERATIAQQLGMSVIDQTSATTLENQRRWFDLSGLVILHEMDLRVPGLVSVQMPDDRIVRVWLQARDGVYGLALARNRVSASNPHQLLVNMAFFGVLMTVIAFLYLRNQLRPITRLADAAQAFGRGRHVPYQPSGALEVRTAGHAFLDMRARIERQIEQRTLMLSGVSHDLRTPITRLRLGLSLLDEEDSAPLLKDVDEMQRLVDEFLAFARGAQEGEMALTDPVALTSDLVADFQRAGVPVSLVHVEGEGRLPLRAPTIRRAIENLVNNAVRYGSKAEISIRLSDKSLRIRVEDDGPGIPPDKRDEAVKPFQRLDLARNQDLGSGVGLGLSIATDAARAHGGVLRLGDSEHLGGLRADIVISR